MENRIKRVQQRIDANNQPVALSKENEERVNAMNAEISELLKQQDEAGSKAQKSQRRYRHHSRVAVATETDTGAGTETEIVTGAMTASGTDHDTPQEAIAHVIARVIARWIARGTEAAPMVSIIIATKPTLLRAASLAAAATAEAMHATPSRHLCMQGGAPTAALAAAAGETR
ncbi:hypothetical protein Emag_005538 [Eimeria magna]